MRRATRGRREDAGQSTLEWAAAFAAAALLVAAILLGWQGARFESTGRDASCTVPGPVAASSCAGDPGGR